MKEIICIFNSSHDSHCRRRVQDLIAAGYRVTVYCHVRNGQRGKDEADYPLHFLADLTSKRYRQRLMIYRREIRDILRTHGRDALYYLYGLDLALVFRLVAQRVRYIYEEADLMHLEAGLQRYRVLPKILECLDKQIIRRASLAIFTSEGFLRYHFAKKRPANTCLALNKADRRLLDLPRTERMTDIDHLNISFIGFIRYKTVYRFAEVVGRMFPQHTFHFYGPMNPEFEPLREYPNIRFHGAYTNPDDLPRIYAATDLAVATYDAAQPNVRYAEPNKLYEALVMQTPIVVSEDTFLARQVEEAGSGWSIDATHEEHIAQFISSLTAERIASCRKHIASIPREQMIADNSELIKRLQALC